MDKHDGPIYNTGMQKNLIVTTTDFIKNAAWFSLFHAITLDNGSLDFWFF